MFSLIKPYANLKGDWKTHATQSHNGKRSTKEIWFVVTIQTSRK